MASARAKPQRTAQAQEASTSHSGRLLLRMPPALHAELAETADREGQSLNAYITGVLADRNGKPPPARTFSRAFRIAVVVDLVLVAVATSVAIALLLVAWL